jgi:transcriptional regulator with XRE-family HTH domain
MNFQQDLKRYKARHYNTVKEIGALLGVSQRTAYRLLNGEKVPTKKQAEYFAGILAKSDPDLFALADLQMSIKSIQAEQSAQQAELIAKQSAASSHHSFMMLMHKDLREQKTEIDYIIPTVIEILQYQLETQSDLTSLWSELQAQKAEIDRLYQAKPSVWQRVINFIRGTN